MIEEINKIFEGVIQSLHSIKTIEELTDLKVSILGRKGSLSILMKGISELSLEEKKTIGKESNILKKKIEALFNDKEAKLNQNSGNKKIDITEPGEDLIMGHIHPISKVQREVEDIFVAMGFSVYEGPDIDDEYNNFDSLNIPSTHPARDMQDTFFFDSNALLLRTHTSNTQNRIYKDLKPPFKVIIPGRCYRNEATDASHDITFHQVEGVVVGKDISLANLKGVMKNFLSSLFKKEVKVRFRPGYFPFVEPGLELDFSCLLCDGKGCTVCKKTGWLEFMGCGMIHPKVLEMGGIDTKEYNGFAFGFGLTRLVMMRYGIEDIRHFHSGDMRFLEQF